MAQVTFDPVVGGDGSTVSDDSSLTTGLANGGFRTRLVPAFGQIVAIAVFVKNKALETLGYRNAAEGFAGAANDARVAAEAAAAVAGSAAAFVDTNPIVKGSADPTRQMRVEVDGNVQAGTTRVVNAPPDDGTMATQEYVASHVANVAPTIEDAWAISLAI